MKKIEDSQLYKLLALHGFKPEQFDSHETDLYVSLIDQEQRDIFFQVCNILNLSWFTCYSDVKGQNWYGKYFYGINFYLM